MDPMASMAVFQSSEILGPREKNNLLVCQEIDEQREEGRFQDGTSMRCAQL